MADNRIDYAFGDLNPTFSSNIKKRYPASTKIKTATLLRPAIENVFQSDALKAVGRFKAIVLRVEKSLSEPGDWLTDNKDLQGADGFVRVKARIPELHPFPAPNGPEDHRIINLYPTFKAQRKGLLEPQPGSLIWVDFGNRETQEDPIYLEVINDGIAVASSYGAPTARQVVDKPVSPTAQKRNCNETLGAKPPKGDSISKAKTPLEITQEAAKQATQISNQTPTAQTSKGCSERPVVGETKVYTIPAAGSPKGLIMPRPDTVVPGNGPCKRISMFIIHETAGGGRAVNYAKNRNKKGSGGVHFWLDRNGELVQTAELDESLPHANWCNGISIGCEVVNPSIGGKDKAIYYLNKGYNVTGPDGNIKTTQSMSTEVGSAKNYVMPNLVQCEQVWNLIKWLSSGPKSNVNVPLQFPVLQWGIKRDNKNAFIWSRFSGDTEFRGNESCYTWWRDGEKKITKEGGPKVPLKHYGITSHQRWCHADGCFIEYYCMARAGVGSRVFTSKEAYYCAIGALLDKKRRLSLLPNDGYVVAGANLWLGSGNPSLNVAYEGELVSV